jgi:hypothetical protein
MRETTARQRQALRDTIQRQLLMDRLNGYISGDSACSRGDSFAAYFNVTPQGGSAGQRRRLSGAGAGAAAPPPGPAGGGDYISQWQGYYQVLAALQRGPGGAAAGPRLAAPERTRLVGTRGNRIVAGLLLHATRRDPGADCSGRFSVLDFACRPGAGIASMRNTSAAADYLSQLLAASASGLVPYGTDPVFLRSSQLYQPGLAGSVGGSPCARARGGGRWRTAPGCRRAWRVVGHAAHAGWQQAAS